MGTQHIIIALLKVLLFNMCSCTYSKDYDFFTQFYLGQYLPKFVGGAPGYN